MSFTGEYLNKFDDAGRVSLPAKMREELRSSNSSDTLMIYFSPITKCLRLMPKQAFDEVMKEASANKHDIQAVKAFRQLAASAYQVDINSSGRITIPAKHREAACLGDECYIIGNIDQIEIWNKEKWEAECTSFNEEFQDSKNISNAIDFRLY